MYQSLMSIWPYGHTNSLRVQMTPKNEWILPLVSCLMGVDILYATPLVNHSMATQGRGINSLFRGDLTSQKLSWSPHKGWLRGFQTVSRGDINPFKETKFKKTTRQPLAVSQTYWDTRRQRFWVEQILSWLKKLGETVRKRRRQSGEYKYMYTFFVMNDRRISRRPKSKSLRVRPQK